MAVPAAERVHGLLVHAAGEHTLPTTDLEKAFARLDDLEANRTKAIEHLESERTDIEKKLPPSLVAVSRMLAAVKQFCEAISSHAKAVEALTKSRQDLAVRQRWQKFIGEACDALQRGRGKARQRADR